MNEISDDQLQSRLNVHYRPDGLNDYSHRVCIFVLCSQTRLKRYRNFPDYKPLLFS